MIRQTVLLAATVNIHRAILLTDPSICKSWGKAIAENGLKDVDIIEWGKCRRTDHVDRMLPMLITRSSNSLRKLSASGISNDIISSFISNHARNLETLWLPIGLSILPGLPESQTSPGSNANSSAVACM
ncbi:hypothetical protein GIB67_037966 [Kingdonia uniflora]|uniref:Uncharacterized protein n=1 Tax=Kingdonia uniflora TaxID=39325 RepID=A0A7J7LHG5_9MAGN|nr:hypothetical protein GIB67_037966 [Kingdonia uniflora]